MTTGIWDRETFVEKLRAIGARAYHDKHPFHVAMNEGHLSPEALRGWVANRFYYQRNIPLKDAAILSNCPVREVRRVWIHRILDHDGLLPQRTLQQPRLRTKAASKPGCDSVKRAGCRAPNSWKIGICDPEFVSQWTRT